MASQHRRRRHHRRRPGRHRRLRQRRRLRLKGTGRRLRRPCTARQQLRFIAGGWRVDEHPRFLADTTGDGRADISSASATPASTCVQGSSRRLLRPRPARRQQLRVQRRRLARRPAPTVPCRHHRRRPRRHRRLRCRRLRLASPGGWVVRAPQLVVNNFGFNAGGWRARPAPRFLADATGDGRADIVGFGNAGVYVSRAQADGSAAHRSSWFPTSGSTPAAGASVSTCSSPTRRETARRHRRLRQRRRLRVQGPGRRLYGPQLVVENFGYNAGGWRAGQHRGSSPTRRGTDAPTSSASATPASTCPAQADGSFGPVELLVTNFGYDAGAGGSPAPATARRHHRRWPSRCWVRQRRSVALPLVGVEHTVGGGGPGGPSPHHP